MGLNNVLIQVFRFIILLAVQILVMSNIKLFGYSSPFIYIIFILGFPLNTNKNLLIFLGFLLGLSMDIYSNTGGDRKSTRLNSSHVATSYAVFCLKKKK